MVAEQSLYSLLTSAAGVTALISTRIYPDAMPEGCIYPAIVFARNSTEPIASISNINFGSDVTMTVDCWAKTRSSADAVAAAVTSAINNSDFFLTGREAGFDSESGLFATILTVIVFETP